LTLVPALVGELAEVNHILEDLVDRLQEVTRFLAVGAAYVFSWSSSTLSFLLIWICEIVFIVTELTIELLLTVFTEKLIALFAFLRLEWEMEAHHTLCFLDHLPLELIKYQWHFNIKAGNWFGAHDFSYSFIRDNKL